MTAPAPGSTLGQETQHTVTGFAAERQLGPSVTRGVEDLILRYDSSAWHAHESR